MKEAERRQTQVTNRRILRRGARSVLYRAPDNSGAETRPENGNACHEALQTLAQETPPSPQRGEGWGEGVRMFQIFL